jgi:hypothetical protein
VDYVKKHKFGCQQITEMAAEKKAREEREAERAPDKVKLFKLADAYDAIIEAELKTKEGRNILESFTSIVLPAIKNLRKIAEAL